MKLTEEHPGVIAVAFIFLGLLLLSTYAHCTTTAKHGNSLGVVQYADRPVQYLEASIVGGSVHVEGKQELTTVRFQPTGTYALFTEDWTFCGNRADLINGKTGVIVLSFSTVQHHRDCYDLYSVHKVQEEPMQ